MQQRDARGSERLLMNPEFFKTSDILVYFTDLYLKLYRFSLSSGPETSCSISATRGILCNLAPPYFATISTCNGQRRLGRWGRLTHCWTSSTSSMLTPTLLVPLRCQAVCRGRFCIMIPDNVTNSVSGVQEYCGRKDRIHT